MELNKINSSMTNWGAEAANLNENFDKVSTAIEQVKNATIRNKGYFSSEAALKSAVPTATKGDKAYVGSTYPYQIWTWNGSAWTNSGSTGGEEYVNLGDYHTADYMDGKFYELGSKFGLSSIVTFDNDNIGTNNTYFDLSIPFPVKSGESYKFTTDINPPTECSLYLWGKDGENLGYGYMNVGGTSFVFNPSMDAVATRLSIRGSQSFVANGEAKCVLSEREVALLGDIQSLDAKIEQTKKRVEGFDSELKELNKEATSSNNGLMSAEDKRKIDEALGNVSKINFKGDEIGANNTYFDFSSPIPVKSGVTYRFSVDLNNPTSCSNYMWDGDTNLGYVFFNIGAKSFEFVPNIDGVVTRMSLRADNGIPFYAEGSISITIAEGNVAYKESIIQVNKDIQNIINKITVKYNILKGYYTGNTGEFISADNYVCTNLLPITSGKEYHTPNAFRFTFYRADKRFIESHAGSIGVIPDEAYYLGITYTASDWDESSFYFYTDDLNDAIVYKSDLIASAYYQEFKNNLINEPIEEIVESGEYGTTSAVYRIPVRCTGKYVIGIDFKFPSNFNASTDVLDIFSFGSVPNYTRLNGACKALITCAVATSEYQQPKCNGMVSVYTNTATSASVPIPSGRCEYKGGQNDNAMPFGETAFSVRYTGESNTKTVTLDDTGLVVKNNGIVEVTIPYPTNKSLVDFANSIVSACDGTDFECNIYDVFAKSTDDLVRVSDIPLRYTYSYGEDAFPIFFKTIDKKWHRIEVVFDNDKVSGSKYMEMFVDGNPQKWSNIPALNLGTGVFDDYIVIGGNGVEVRNFSYKNNSTKISSPRIVVEMLHNIKNEVSSGAGGGESQDEGNLICAQEIEGIISTYQRNGYKHISLEEVMNYLNGNVELKGKFFCIIHDDDYFVANHPLVEKTYKRHGIKAAFAIINDFMSESEAEHFKKTGNLFQYTLHHQLGWASVPYSQLCEIMETDISALQDRLSTGTNMAIYPGGGHNLAVQEVLASYGLGYCGIVGSKTGTTSRANDKMAAPRMIRSLGKYDGLQAEIDTYSKFYD